MGKKILIADDEDRIRQLVKTTLELEDAGFEIFEARDGKEAITKAMEVRPELVILDVMMPGKSGYEVCKELKKSPDTRDVYVLFLSARGNVISERTMRNSGGDEFVSKPFIPKELGSRVKKALGIA